MARTVRDAIGQIACVISDYSAAVLAEAKRIKAWVIADRPSRLFELALKEARSRGEIAGLIVVNSAGNGVPPFLGAPSTPRKIIFANGEHSSKEAIAFDLRALGHDVAQIGEWLRVDAETARTFVRRAEQKNKRHAELDEVMRRLMPADGEH